MKVKVDLPNDLVGFDRCYAVTDQHVLLPLKVTGCNTVGDLVQIETELDCEPTTHREAHHETYFKVIWLDAGGLPDKAGVFVRKEDAIAHAVRNTETEIRAHKKTINGLNKRLDDLKASL